MDLNYKIKSLIKAKNKIDISELMSAISSDPEYGYYSSQYELHTNKDFITSPEISQLFGEVIGIWSAYQWQQLSSPKEISFVELGPGRGTMMYDILLATRNVPGFHKSVNINMIETSIALQKIQKSNLSNLQNVNISWHNNFADIPKQPLILVCNEFFDALPVNQYIKLSNEWHEIMVTMKNGTEELYFIYETVNARTCELLNLDYPNVPNGGIVEISYQAIDIIKQIAEHIKIFGGVALIIDYGYDRDNKRSDQQYISTLQAIYNHKFHPILQNLGEADITAHVDFYSLCQAALIKGIKVMDIISQGKFLQDMGIQIRARTLLSKLNNSQAEELLTAMERLISPSQMGDLFKVLIIGS
ncbi:MAG: class I SAM-dependent methyltransferase [Rickettsiales endosymbiont of Dermacentor nuttalli]